MLFDFSPQNCREEYGEHTCDKRNTRAWLSATYPELTIEEGFAEQDELWTANVRESKEHTAGRAKKVMDMIFDNEKEDSK